jgi:hypothetical protein
MPFDPSAHLIKLQGKDYLEVRWRLAWLREAHPDATIVTEIVQIDTAAEWAVIRATVTLPTGGSATGMALQRPTAIAKDYIANGETSAIGRALGALGFGTQHAVEFDQGEQVVDAPVTRPSPVAASASAPMPPRPEPDPALVTARAGLQKTLKARDLSWPDAVEAATKVWPNIKTKEDLGLLTAHQFERLTEVFDGRSVIAPDAKGHLRILPAPTPPLVNQLADAVR